MKRVMTSLALVIALMIPLSSAAQAYSMTASSVTEISDKSNSSDKIEEVEDSELSDAYIYMSDELFSTEIVTDLCYEDFVAGYELYDAGSLQDYVMECIDAEIAKQKDEYTNNTDSSKPLDTSYLSAVYARDEGIMSEEESEILAVYESLMTAMDEAGADTNIYLPYEVFQNGYYSSDYSASDYGELFEINSTAGKWYDNLGTSSPSLPQEASYSKYNLLSVVKKGDIIHETEGLVAQLTGHIAIIYGKFWDSTYHQYYFRTIEANSHGVVYGALDDTRYDARGVKIYRVSSATSTQISGALSFCRTQLGKSYNLAGIITSGSGTTCNFSSSSGSWYCSELVWAAYYNQGINLYADGVIPFNVYTPAALAKSSKLVKITVSAA